jgi:hypothetical protein
MPVPAMVWILMMMQFIPAVIRVPSFFRLPLLRQKKADAGGKELLEALVVGYEIQSARTLLA